MDREDSDLGNRDKGDGQGTSTIQTVLDSARLQRSLAKMAADLNRINQNAAPLATVAKRMQDQLAVTFAPMQGISAELNRIAEAHAARHEALREITRQTFRPALADHLQEFAALDVKMGEAARSMASMGEDLRPLVESALQAFQAAGAASPAASVAAARILDEVTRPPDPSSDATVEAALPERVATAGEAVNLDFDAMLRVVMLLLAVIQSWCAYRTDRSLDRIEAGRREMREEVMDRLDVIVEEVRSPDDADSPANGSQGARQ